MRLAFGLDSSIARIIGIEMDVKRKEALTRAVTVGGIRLKFPSNMNTSDHSRSSTQGLQIRTKAHPKRLAGIN